MNINEPVEKDMLSKEDRIRSEFVRNLVQNANAIVDCSMAYLNPLPKCIIQFWDNLNQLPSDVKLCMDSWRKLEADGFEIQVFDEHSAKEFIKKHLGTRFVEAFEKCYHPSMKSDYFRYSYIFVKGGFYIDADDIYNGGRIDHLFTDGRLKLQPFCYDIKTAQMVSPTAFTIPGVTQLNWIFYFNTTPLIAACKHPIVERMLFNATVSLEMEIIDELPEVQATTGPGNLTRSLFEFLADKSDPDEEILVLNEWEKISISKWPLSYRNDKRNWRLSNQQAYGLQD